MDFEKVKETVSYTHLDVYKRQGLNMAAPPFRSNFWLIPWYKIGASLSSQPGLK